MFKFGVSPAHNLNVRYTDSFTRHLLAVHGAVFEYTVTVSSSPIKIEGNTYVLFRNVGEVKTAR